jgi:DNA-binding CsgD family transcriptional regulator
LTVFALLCSFPRGDPCGAFFAAVYYIGIEEYAGLATAFFYFAYTGQAEPRYTAPYYFFRILCCVIILGWAYLYYRVIRKLPAKMPCGFWLVTALPLLGSLGVLGYYTNTARALLEDGVNIFFAGGIVAAFLCILNIGIFYTRVRLALAYAVEVSDNKAADAPLVRTKKNGLPEAFIRKYRISEAELRVAELLIRGKSNKEIAGDLRLSPRTVESHLLSVYKKTGVSSRFALTALLKS